MSPVVLARRRRLLPAFFAVGLSIAAGLITVGGFGLAHGLYEKGQLRPVRGWAETSGVVTAVTKSCFRSCVYKAHVRFSDASGQTRDFVAPGSGSPMAVGSAARLAYNPNDPRQAHDLSIEGSNWNVEIGTMIFLIVLGCLALVGLAITFRAVPRTAPAQR